MTPEKLLMTLGVTPNYKGFEQAAYLLHTLQSEPSIPHPTTTQLYAKAGARYGVSWKAVERNIRTIVDVAWQQNPTFLRSVAYFPLSKKPRAAQFLSILAEYLTSSSIAN